MGREARVNKPRTTKGGTTTILTAKELVEITKIHPAATTFLKGAK